MDWSEFFPYVMPYVRGCDEDTIVFSLQQAAIDFFGRTQAWRVELPITSVACESTYTLPLPEGAVLSRLLSLTVDCDDSYDVTSTEQGRSNDRNSSCGTYAYLSDDRSQIVIRPAPECAGLAVLPYVTLKPTRDATSIPDELFEAYCDDIANGALARLLSMSRVEWADKATAAEKAGEYRSRCGVVTAQVAKGNARARQRVVGRFF